MHRNTMLKEGEGEDEMSNVPARSFSGSQSSSSFWQPFINPFSMMRDMFRQFSQLEREMDSFFNSNENARPSIFGPPPGFLGDSILTPSFPSRDEIVTEGDENKYKLNVFLGENFPSENVKVTEKDGVLTVEAKSEQISGDGSSRMYQQFVRQYTLPNNVDAKEVKSILSPNGLLKIEAPVPFLPEPPKPVEIPVMHL